MSSVTYNARGQVTGWTHGSGVTTTREYDATTERLTRIFVKKPSPESRFLDLAYAYDPVGNPVQITDQLATSTFTANSIIPNSRRFAYDPRYRLVTSTGKRHTNATDGVDAPVSPAPAATDYVPYTHRYSYDAVGNFTTHQEHSKSAVKYNAGLLDRFDGVGAENYGYDANGCVTSTPRHTSIGHQFDAQPTLIDLGGGGKIRLRRHGDQRVVRFRPAGWNFLEPEDAAAVSTDMDALFGGTARDLSAPTQSILESVKTEPTPEVASERGRLTLRFGNGQVAISDVVTGAVGSIDVWLATGAAEDDFASWASSQGGVTGALHAHAHENAGGNTTSFTGNQSAGAPGIPSGAGAAVLEQDMKNMFTNRSFPAAYAVVPDVPLRRSTITAVPPESGVYRYGLSGTNTSSIETYASWIRAFSKPGTFVYSGGLPSNAALDLR